MGGNKSGGEAVRPAELVVLVNSERRTANATDSVSDLLATMLRDPHLVAVELNGTILPRGEYSSTRLADADRLEIVQFVQGG